MLSDVVGPTGHVYDIENNKWKGAVEGNAATLTEGDFLRRPGDDHTLSIFDKAIQGHTDQYALKFVKPGR
jgi:predicted methyltransferase